MRAVFVSLSVLVGHALGAVFITNPVNTTSASGGNALTVSWKDDSATPTLAQIGACSIGIYVGNSLQQTEIQNINASVDVSTTSSVSFVVDSTIGPNSNLYFVRFTSLGLADATNSQFNYESFSAKFTLTNMTGTFSAAAQSQIDAASTISLTSSTSSASSSSTTSKVVASTTTSSKAATSTSNSTAAATTTGNSTSNAFATRGNIGALGVAVAFVSLVL